MIISAPGFEIEADRARSLLKLTLKGFWNEATLADYARSLAKANEALRGPGRRSSSLKILIDLREHEVQSKEIAAGLQKIIDGEATAEPCAVILPPSIIKKAQTARIGNAATNQQFFPNEEEALAWLSAVADF